MIKNIIFFSCFFSLLISPQNEKRETIMVNYAAISCNCAQWKIINSKSKEHIYLERKDKNIPDADKIWDGKTVPLKLKISGNFKKETGLPAGISLKGNPKPARVFQYDKIEIVQNK